MVSRRSVFVAAGWWGALGALAACGTGERTGALPGVESSRGNANGSDTPPSAQLPGKLLYVGDSNIWVWEKGAGRRLTEDRISRQPVWSPDGKRIALVKIAVSSSEVWVMDADSANSRQLTRNESKILLQNDWAFRPIWWPGMSRLLYLSEETTNDLMLWQIGLDGRNRRVFLSVPDREGGLDTPSLSPDARRLALVSYRGTGLVSQVWTYGLPSGPWRQLTETSEGAYDPAWSPDGTRIAYVTREKGRHDVWVMHADGSNPQPVTQNGSSRAPCWSPDSQYLAYCAAESASFELRVIAAPDAAAPALAASGLAAPAASAAAAAAGSSRPAEGRETRTAPSRQLTRGAQVDPVSGLSWTR